MLSWQLENLGMEDPEEQSSESECPGVAEKNKTTMLGQWFKLVGNKELTLVLPDPKMYGFH